MKSVDEASAPQLATPAAKSFDMTPIIAEEPTEEPTNTVADLPDEHAGTVVGLPDEREAGTTYFVDL